MAIISPSSTPCLSLPLPQATSLGAWSQEKTSNGRWVPRDPCTPSRAVVPGIECLSLIQLDVWAGEACRLLDLPVRTKTSTWQEVIDTTDRMDIRSCATGWFISRWPYRLLCEDLLSTAFVNFSNWKLCDSETMAGGLEFDLIMGFVLVEGFSWSCIPVFQWTNFATNQWIANKNY